MVQTPERKIKRADELLQNIAAGLNKLDDHKLGCLEVWLYQDGKPVLKAGVAEVLDFLANDIFWNEDGSWEDAERAEVVVL